MKNMRNLSKNERRRLKRQRRKERQDREQSEKRNQGLKRMIKILVPVIIVIGVAGVLASLSLADAPKVQVTPVYHDFGDVPAGGNKVSTLMDVTNTGRSDLIISGMDSSCGCTSASMLIDGVEGPMFSMAGHGTNPRDWSVRLGPGETSQLKVYYDPNVHMDFRGPVTRYITLFSNDPLNSHMRVTIEANQV